MEERPLDYHGKAPTTEEEQKALKQLCEIEGLDSARPKEQK